MPVQVLFKIAQVRPADRTTFGIDSHPHKVSGCFPISAVLGRGDKIVLLKELRDELLRALPVVRALRLVHELLHDLREFVVACFLSLL